MKTTKHNKLIMLKLKSLNGYDAIRETLDGNNTLTVKQPVINETQQTQKSVLV